ncbi:MAG: PHP domain-containing protein [Oscillospiraceae bacterium]|nr:PHP domain-containing protein [Oscillospiraceae bacterium]
MKHYIDLHMHSTCSDDGEFTPSELVRQCEATGVRIMSITDHNSARGNREAREAAEACGIRYIAGIEIDCVFRGRNLHLLGYGIDAESPDFAALEAQMLADERKASWERLALTQKLGFDISAEELNKFSDINDPTKMWNGEVFAEVLLEKAEYMNHPLLRPYRTDGARSENPFVNFYWDYYAQDKSCYVKVEFPALKDAIALVRDNGGKAVLAHPGNNLKGRLELFNEIVKQGIDGVEVFCSYHDEAIAKYFYEQTVNHSLRITCGSDYHGKTKPSVKLGETGCWGDPQEVENKINF